MRLKKHVLIERASTLNSSAERTLVLASETPKLPNGQECEGFACNECGADFVSNPNSQPFCVNCGSEEVDINTDTPIPPLPETDDDMVAVQCRNTACSTFNIVHQTTASTLRGVMHCVTCGSTLAYNDEFNDGGDSPADTRPNEGNDYTPADTRPNEGTGKTPADTRPAFTNNRNVIHAAEGFDFDDIEDEEADFDVTDQIPLDETANEPSEPLEPESVQNDDIIPACNTAMELSSVILASNAQATLDLMYSGEKLYAMLDGTHVATLSKDTAGDNASILNTVSLAHTIKQIAHNEGVKAALKHFGFKAVCIKFPQSKVNAALVERQTKKVASTFYARANEIQEDLEQCVALAATGLTRNFFAKHQNVLKQGFSRVLATAGVKNADRLVAGVFERYGDEYHRTLFEIAGDLMKKPIEIRNELADTLEQVNPGAQEPQEDTIEDRLEAGVRPVVSNVISAGNTTVAARSIASLREATGGSLFNR